MNVTPALDVTRDLNDLHSLKDRVAWVPGGSGGLGEAICWGLALQGARVVVSGRDGTKAGKLSGQLSDAGFDAQSVPFDALNVAEINDAADHVATTLGGIDILVNCVGMQIEQSLLEVTEEAFDEVYATNLKAAMFLGQAAARHQLAGADPGEKAWGRQVHLLSVRSQLGIRKRGYSAYCSTKGGMAMMVKQHAVELAPHGITVNAVAPTFVYTELIRYIVDDPEYHATLVGRIPIGRIAEPKDIVAPVLFFCSPGAGSVWPRGGRCLHCGLTAWFDPRIAAAVRIRFDEARLE